MINQEIEEVERLRPSFNPLDLRLDDNSTEFSIMPSEFVPHTVTMFLISKTDNSIMFDDEKCKIVFEYNIDESKGERESVDFGIEFILGKYTKKVLEIIIDVRSFDYLLSRMAIVANQLEIRKERLAKRSHRKHYELVIRLINEMLDSLAIDKEARELFYD